MQGILGCMEGRAGNHERAYKHYILSAKGGYKGSLEFVKKGFMGGDVTKEEYESTYKSGSTGRVVIVRFFPVRGSVIVTEIVSISF